MNHKMKHRLGSCLLTVMLGWTPAAPVLATEADPARPGDPHKSRTDDHLTRDLQTDRAEKVDKDQVVVVKLVIAQTESEQPADSRNSHETNHPESSGNNDTTSENQVPLENIITLLALPVRHGKIEWTDIPQEIRDQVEQLDYQFDFAIEPDQKELVIACTSTADPVTLHLLFEDESPVEEYENEESEEPSDEESHRIQAESNEEKIVGKQTLTRRLAANQDGKVEFNLLDMQLPEGYELVWDELQPYEADVSKMEELTIPVRKIQEKTTVTFDFVDEAEISEENPEGIVDTITAVQETQNAPMFFALPPAPAGFAWKDPGQEMLKVDAGTIEETVQVPVVRSADSALMKILFTDTTGNLLGSSTYQVSTKDSEKVSINLNSLQDLSLPVGYKIQADTNMAQVTAGTTQAYNLVMEEYVAPTAFHVEYVEDGLQIGSQDIHKSLLPANSKVTLGVNNLELPAGYALANHVTEISGNYGTSNNIKIPVTRSAISVKIIFVDEDGAVVDEYTGQFTDGRVEKSKLKVPNGYSLDENFTSQTFAGNGELKLKVKKDATGKDTVFNITYKDPKGSVVGMQKKTFVPNGSSATLTLGDLSVPYQFKLDGGFDSVTIDAGQTKNLDITVQKDEGKADEEEATFEIVYVNSASEVVGKQTATISGSGEVTLKEGDLELPEGYILKDRYSPVTTQAGSTKKVELTVEKGGDTAIFKITYKTADKETVGSQTVTLNGTTGSASLEQSMLNLPAGYKIKGNYTAPTCSYGKTLTVEITVEKDGSSSSSSSSSSGSSSSSNTPASGNQQSAVLQVVYYETIDGRKETVKTEEFTSEDKGEKGKEYLFELDKTFQVKAPTGFTLVDGSPAKKVSVNYGYSGTLEIEVKKTNVSTAVASGRNTFMSLFAISSLGLGALYTLRKSEPEKDGLEN